jgi:hypothetical protein
MWRCKAKKDIHYNGQKKTDKTTDNDLQNSHRKLKIGQHEPQIKRKVKTNMICNLTSRLLLGVFSSVPTKARSILQVWDTYIRSGLGEDCAFCTSSTTDRHPSQRGFYSTRYKYIMFDRTICCIIKTQILTSVYTKHIWNNLH